MASLQSLIKLSKSITVTQSSFGTIRPSFGRVASSSVFTPNRLFATATEAEPLYIRGLPLVSYNNLYTIITMNFRNHQGTN